MKGKCYIILSYIENMTEEYIIDCVKDADFIICADGGEAIAHRCSITPDVVIGDFDSDPLTERFDCEYITYPSEKDLTDAEACLLYATEKGYSDITLLGGIGGRLDHTIGAINSALKFFHRPDGGTNRIVYQDMQNMHTILENGTIKLEKSPLYKYFALSSIDSIARGITITGAKYELSDADLLRASSLGISNEITDDEAVITVKEGLVLVIRSSDSKK